MVSRIQGTWFRARGTGCMTSRVRGTWFREHGVHSFEGTGRILTTHKSLDDGVYLFIRSYPVLLLTSH